VYAPPNVSGCQALPTQAHLPDRQIARIRLSDKISRLHPRHVVPKPRQAYETEVPVKMRLARPLSLPTFRFDSVELRWLHPERVRDLCPGDEAEHRQGPWLPRRFIRCRLRNGGIMSSVPTNVGVSGR
jgi:hypothetical protein